MVRLVVHSGRFLCANYFVHCPIEIFSTVQKFVHKQVTDILKVRLRFLHTFSYGIKFRTLPTMYGSVRKLIPHNCIPLYSM